VLTGERLAWAAALLDEAVYRSRERQAAGLSPLAGSAPGCGLGERAEVVLELSPRGAELAAKLWPGSDPTRGELGAGVAAVVAGWVERQDALDRKRNHFLKRFRGEHGFDRSAYGPAVAAELEAGLAAVNAEVDAGREAAARALCGEPGHAAGTT